MKVLMNRLRLHFGHLNENEFRHNFGAAIDPLCSCGLEPEAALHYLWRCNLSSDFGIEHFNDLCALNPTFKNLSHENLSNSLLYGSENFTFNRNKEIRKFVIKLLKPSECFIGPFFWPIMKQKNIEWTNLFINTVCIFVCSTWI